MPSTIESFPPTLIVRGFALVLHHPLTSHIIAAKTGQDNIFVCITNKHNLFGWLSWGNSARKWRTKPKPIKRSRVGTRHHSFLLPVRRKALYALICVTTAMTSAPIWRPGNATYYGTRHVTLALAASVCSIRGHGWGCLLFLRVQPCICRMLSVPVHALLALQLCQQIPGTW